MLQDLDQLAARIGQLVQRTRQLQAERDALRARLRHAEDDAQTLRERHTAAEAQARELQARLDNYDNETGARLAQAQAAEASLRAELEQHLQTRQAQESQFLQTRQALEAEFAAREQEWQTRLNACDTDRQRLRVAAAAARERIDAVLARLPGATAAVEAPSTGVAVAGVGTAANREVPVEGQH